QGRRRCGGQPGLARKGWKLPLRWGRLLTLVLGEFLRREAEFRLFRSPLGCRRRRALIGRRLQLSLRTAAAGVRNTLLGKFLSSLAFGTQTVAEARGPLWYGRNRTRRRICLR